MLTNKWLELTRKTKNYRLKARLGWGGWLPDVQIRITLPIWEFIVQYWMEFKEIVKANYRINLESATDVELAKFFLETGLYQIETINDAYKLTKNQKIYVASLARHFARFILDLIASGDVYEHDAIF